MQFSFLLRRDTLYSFWGRNRAEVCSGGLPGCRGTQLCRPGGQMAMLKVQPRSSPTTVTPDLPTD